MSLCFWDCGNVGVLEPTFGRRKESLVEIDNECHDIPYCSCFLRQEAWLAPTCKTHVYTQSKGAKRISIYPLWSSSTWHECVKVSTSKLAWTIRLCFVDSKSRNPIGLGRGVYGRLYESPQVVYKGKHHEHSWSPKLQLIISQNSTNSYVTSGRFSHSLEMTLTMRSHNFLKKP